MNFSDAPRFTVRFVDEATACHAKTAYRAGDVLCCEYRVDLPSAGAAEHEKDRRVSAIETSVLWETIGKGDEDIGVHFFERRERQSVRPEVIRQWHRLNTALPLAPLSYEGRILKIRWLVRVRLFLADGTIHTEDVPFRMVAPGASREPAEANPGDTGRLE